MPTGGKRTSLAASYTWGQQDLEAQFGNVFQPDAGIFSPGIPPLRWNPSGCGCGISRSAST
jgi:hypothetical protein